MARQEGDAPPTTSGRKGFSSRLLQMKFMQRKQEKRKLDEVEDGQQVAESKEWVAEAAPEGCVVISEPDPPPGALLGKMAFGGFNPETAKLQAGAEARLEEARKAREGEIDGTAVSDVDMAKRLGREDKMVKSMRMQKKARKK